MTNEEAAILLKQTQITLARGTGKVLLAEALRLAISALMERKNGRWIDETFEPHGLVFYPYRCDQCGEHNNIPSDYCPFCGADMRGKNNE